MAEAIPTLSVRRAGSLITVSALAFLGGMYFPLAVLAEPGPSAMAYGILVVGLPAWVVGAAAGALAAWLVGREERRGAYLRTVAGALAVLNLLAIVACALWDPLAVS